jgi:hypothetical protein
MPRVRWTNSLVLAVALLFLRRIFRALEEPGIICNSYTLSNFLRDSLEAARQPASIIFRTIGSASFLPGYLER